MKTSLLYAILLSIVPLTSGRTPLELENFTEVYLRPSTNAALIEVIHATRADLSIDPRHEVLFEAQVIDVIKGDFEVGRRVLFFEVFEGPPIDRSLADAEGCRFYVFPSRTADGFFVDVGERWRYDECYAAAVERWRAEMKEVSVPKRANHSR